MQGIGRKEENSMPFTPEQQSAIDQRDKTLLVSAAAGAGKTTTLTARIITSLLDEKHPADISRMLVITYTKASAADLRAHVRDALREACEEHPENSRLAEQLSALPSAQISTVDSFFYRLLKEHAAEAGVSPSVRIADEAEKTILMREVMSRLVNRLYEGEAEEICSSEDFCALAELLTEPKEEAGVADVLLELYRVAANYPERTGYLSAKAERVLLDSEGRVEDSLFGQFIFAQTREMCASAMAYLQKAADRACAEEPENEPSISKVLKSDLALLQNMADSTRVSFAQTREAFTSFKAAVFRPKVSGADLELLEEFKAAREVYKKTVGQYAGRYYSFAPAAWKQALAETGKNALLVCKIIDGFTALYENEKNRRRICDFSDLEHKLCKILYENGEPSAIAKSVAADFDYIYVDEYQDINRMQHEIISAISRPDNRFMVGDIKQSIYSFRRAEPTLFAQMKKDFPLLSEAGDSPFASVYLSKNFRSTKKTIEGVNGVFDFLFTHAGESIGYEDGDKLICGNGIEGVASPEVVLCYREEENDPAPEEEDPSSLLAEDEEDDSFEGEDEYDSPEEDRRVHEEARYVAKEIKRLLSLEDEKGEPIYEPANIAILLRSVRKKSNVYAKALMELGVGVELSDAKEFFLVPEVLLCLCLLNAVDNPLRDIYLAGLMQSPLYGFSQDDLTRIRMETGVEMPLYRSLLQYAEAHPENTACERLLSDLSRYRTLAECVPVDRLLRRMYDETGLLSLSKNTGGGRENLLMLYHYARTFEGSDFKGLHAFIDYLNQIIQSGNQMRTPARASVDPKKVRIMTVHSSKGLEFPVTFVCGTASGFNETDLRKKVLFHPDFGLTFTLRDETGMVALDTPMREAAKEAIRRSNREEEMRVLYVALTRAVERLYITALAPKKNNTESLLKKVRCIKDAPTGWSILQAKSHFLMVAAAVPAHQLKRVWPDLPQATQGNTTPPDPVYPDPALYEELERRFGFTYPYAYLHRIPGKIAVSRLTPTVLDGTEDELPLLATAHEGQILPAFYQPKEGHSPAERGTATHLFMQFCDFENLHRKGAKAELDRLVEKHFIDAETADLVRIEELERFRKSPFFDTLLSIQDIKREFRFHVRLPAAEYTADETLKFQLTGEYILVQGVIDCILFDEKGEMTLIDYKTDRLTRDELATPALAHEKLFSRHAEQLKYYSLAISEIFGKAPAKIGLYSLHAGQVYWTGKERE